MTDAVRSVSARPASAIRLTAGKRRTCRANVTRTRGLLRHGKDGIERGFRVAFHVSEPGKTQRATRLPRKESVFLGRLKSIDQNRFGRRYRFVAPDRDQHLRLRSP
ncbi:hypothetical protein [Paraburkholderia guartelaensis]|uniref:Uncharacterized protein n=1 Tax=Paraburkholderia guartelaensis TaxID=2546446 RepID=A0ABU9S3Y9_9BURK